MILALVWLTVSTPFVYASQQALKQSTQKSSGQNDGNPFSNTTEEKNESGVNTLSEYLHEIHTVEHVPVVVVKNYKCHSCSIYFAFHPELISPPPEV
jgi:hypothetical protein